MAWLPILILIPALYILIESGKYIVRNIGIIARTIGASEFMLAFAFIAFATSLPELTVGINAAVAGVPELSFGDIVGTNVVNLTLILGLVAVLGGGVTLADYTHFTRTRLLTLTLVLSPLILLLDGTLSRTDGLVLLGLFGVNLWHLLYIDQDMVARKVLRPHLAPHVGEAATPTKRALWRPILLLLVAVCTLLGATFVIVLAAQSMAVALGLPQVVIGTLIIATCTSLPELTIGIRSVLRERGGVALGDIVGAAAINSTLIFGIVALIHPITFSQTNTIFLVMGFMVVIFCVLFIFLASKQALSRREGLVLLGIYSCFVVLQIVGAGWWV